MNPPRSLARRPLLVAALAAATGRAASGPPLVLAGEPLPPFTFERGGRPAGLHWALCEKVMSQLGQPLGWEQLPWRRALADLAQGRLGGIMGTTRGHLNEREEHMVFADEALSHVSSHFVSLSDRPFRFDGLFTLRGLRVGVMGGYQHRPDFMAATYFQRQSTLNHETCLRMLLVGRVDVALVDLAATRYFLHAEGLQERLHIDPHPFGRGQLLLGLARSPAHEALALRFSAALRAFKRTADYATLLKAYGLQRSDVEASA